MSNGIGGCIWTAAIVGAIVIVTCAFICDVGLADGDGQPADSAAAGAILKATGVQGGLIVHLGCGASAGSGQPGKLTADLRANDSYLVHGLDTDADNIAKAREYIRSQRKYGKVSVEQFDGKRLPYAENLVNLLVAEDLGDVPMAEVMRVLAPLGIAYIKADGEWKKTVKPWPKEIDEWTHHMHGPDNNAVAKDSVVGPPRRLQWIEGPHWARNHATPPSTQSAVSSRGRLFTIVDTAAVGVRFPALIELQRQGEYEKKVHDSSGRWYLIARDAFNGIELWRRPLPAWGHESWGSSSWTPPMHVNRKLIASGDSVYATLGFNEPLSMIDAATGKTIRTYDETKNASEVLLYKGTLIVSVNNRPLVMKKIREDGTVVEKPTANKKIVAIKADTGEVLWQTGYEYLGIRNATPSGARIWPRSLLLTAGDDAVGFMGEESVICLNLSDGKERWRAKRPNKNSMAPATHGLSPSNTCKLIYSDGRFILAQPEPADKNGMYLTNKKEKGKLVRAPKGALAWSPAIRTVLLSIDASSGETIWQRECGSWGFTVPPGVYAAAGSLWVHDKDSFSLLGLDPATGEQKHKFSTEKILTTGHHHRCYQNKATEKYLLMGRRNVEFIDFKTGDIEVNPWIRGECHFGILPCNGLLYVPPNPCCCWLETMVQGFIALAPGGKPSASEKQSGTAAGLLVHGPAYGVSVKEKSSDDGQWTTYRHDPLRSGATASAVPSKIKHLWETKVGTSPSGATIADGKVFVSCRESYQVRALNSETGEILWSFTAGGTIDSPATYYSGMILFGSADGWAYCLRASDGELAWRFRAAPEDRRVMAYGRLESAWPVHGSILVKDGIAHIVAGRSSYFDGGIYAYALEPASGKILQQGRLNTTGENSQDVVGGGRSVGGENKGGLSDILISDGESVFMRHVKLDYDAELSGNLGRIATTKHLIALGGFLDDSLYNRVSWLLGSASVGKKKKGVRLWGDMLVFDDSRMYAARTTGVKRGNWASFSPGHGVACAVDRKTGQPAWVLDIPIRVQAMVLAGETLWLTGVPDITPNDDPWGAYEGRKGGVLWAVSAADGKKLAEYKLESSPVWDGMAAAGGRLYISLKNGKVVCFGKD